MSVNRFMGVASRMTTSGGRWSPMVNRPTSLTFSPVMMTTTATSTIMNNDYNILMMTGWSGCTFFSDEQRRFRSNRSRRGLYDGKDVRSGNNVSFSMKATKRKFKPNIFTKRVYSEVLDEMVPFHLTASALRSIDKAGGLDSYLLTSSHITSGEGLEVRKRIIKKLKYESRQTAEAVSSSETSTTTL